MSRVASIIITVALVLFSATTLAQDPLLHFERIHTRIAGETNNRLSVKVFADGTAIATVPPYMKRAGRHEFELPTSRMDEVKSMVDALAGMSQDSLDEERATALSKSSTGMAHDVSDPDTVRFTIKRNDRSKHTLVSPSPDVMRDTRRSESALSQLAEMEDRLRDFVRTATEGRP